MIFSILPAMMAVPVSAAGAATRVGKLLEVDMSSPAFRADIWQNDVATGNIFPLKDAFVDAPTSGGVAAVGEARWAGSLEARDGGIAEGSPSIVNGGRVIYAYFPFTETVRIDSLSWRWNNPDRRYFMRVYTSMDGENWTEATITGNAQRVTLPATYCPEGLQPAAGQGVAGGPSVEVYSTAPAGRDPNNSNNQTNINVLTLPLQRTIAANYLRLAFYGNDNGSGVAEIRQQWISFNNMEIRGAVAPVEVLSVDMSNPAFGSDAFENNVGSGVVLPLDSVFDVAPIAGPDQSRFSTNLRPGEANIGGELTILPNGSAVNYVVFPFEDTVQIDSLTWKWNNHLRHYFIRVYTSMDGETWTEAAPG
jgi:hypothetical protein